MATVRQTHTCISGQTHASTHPTAHKPFIRNMRRRRVCKIRAVPHARYVCLHGTGHCSRRRSSCQAPPTTTPRAKNVGSRQNLFVVTSLTRCSPSSQARPGRSPSRQPMATVRQTHTCISGQTHASTHPTAHKPFIRNMRRRRVCKIRAVPHARYVCLHGTGHCSRRRSSCQAPPTTTPRATTPRTTRTQHSQTHHKHPSRANTLIRYARYKTLSYVALCVKCKSPGCPYTCPCTYPYTCPD